MLVFPNCKINLGLRILRKRPDGFHDLETIFYPIPVVDVLEILPIESEKKGTIKFKQTGVVIQGQIEQNLCVKAYRLLQDKIPDLPSIYLHLQKNIPTGAGLGGGSADGAFVLQTLQEIFQLPLSKEQLMELALQLGSDCPYFLLQKPALGEGRGEKLSPLPISLSGYQILLIHPGFSISTVAAFQGVKPVINGTSLRESIFCPIEEWKDVIVNQFEETVFLRHPELARIKNELYDAGAIYASMSGSGSTLYGIFPPGVNKPQLNKYPWIQWRKIP